MALATTRVWLMSDQTPITTSIGAIWNVVTESQTLPDPERDLVLSTLDFVGSMAKPPVSAIGGGSGAEDGDQTLAQELRRVVELLGKPDRKALVAWARIVLALMRIRLDVAVEVRQ